jgi:hypothetical protein
MPGAAAAAYGRMSMRIYARIYAFAFVCMGAFVFGAASAGALDWPSRQAAVVSNFGSNNKGRAQLGDSFNAAGPVTAVGEGELVIASVESSPATRLPATFGAWLAFDHGDGLLSIYARVEDFDIDRIPKKIEQDIVVANCGTTGWSEKQGFYLSFYDRKERRWVNPSLVIPPREDTRRPVIQSVKLTGGPGGAAVDPAAVHVLKQGHYVINVQAFDTRLSPQENPLSPFRIICLVNGVETGNFACDTFSARDGMLMAYRGALTHVKQIFAPYPAVEAGEVNFSRGQVNLEIIAQDSNGNTNNALYHLFVE